MIEQEDRLRNTPLQGSGFGRDITAMILTYNEEPNIRRSLAALSWVKTILIIDSFSDDRTRSIAGEFSNVQWVERAFDSFAGQCNFGLSKIQSEWVFSADADYCVSDGLAREIQELRPEAAVAGYSVPFKYCIHGRSLRAALYPPRTVLYRRRLARYEQIGHGHRVVLDGPVERLSNAIHHDDRKPLGRWFKAQIRYAEKESEYLIATPADRLKLADRIRKRMILAPPLVFLYCLIGRRLFLDGRAGWFYVFQRTLAEILLSLDLLERRLKSAPEESHEEL